MAKECEWHEPPTRYCNHCWHETEKRFDRIVTLEVSNSGRARNYPSYSTGNQDFRRYEIFYECCHCHGKYKDFEDHIDKPEPPNESYQTFCRRIHQQNM